MGGSSVLTKYGPVGSHGDPVCEVCCSNLGVHLSSKCAKNIKNMFFACLDGAVQNMFHDGVAAGALLLLSGVQALRVFHVIHKYVTPPYGDRSEGLYRIF